MFKKSSILPDRYEITVDALIQAKINADSEILELNGKNELKIATLGKCRSFFFYTCQSILQMKKLKNG